MSSIRVLVGTRKGAFILTSDGKRKKWDVTGPHFAGWEIYHMKGSPVDPNRIYASQTSGWFGQIIQRSDDGGKTWHQPGTPAGEPTTTPEGMPKGESNKFVYDTSPNRQAAHARTSGTTARSTRGSSSASGTSSRRSPTRTPSTPASKTPPCSDRPTAARPGTSWPASAATARAASGSPAPAAWACTRSCSTRRIPKRIFIAISAAGAFRTDDGGKTWKPINRGLQLAVHPRPRRRGRPLRPPHRACTRRGPNTLFMQKHWDVMRTDNAGDNWREVSGNLPTDFGFPIDVHAHEPETVYVVPIKSDCRALPARRQAPRLPQPDRRQRVGAAHQGPAAERLLRQRPARRDGRRYARHVRHLLRHHRRPGLLLARLAATTGRRSSATCRPCCRSRCRRSSEAATKRRIGTREAR